ncbi:MAG: hypothetical protein RIB98_17155 [Acidimicrobiales bacterium]
MDASSVGEGVSAGSKWLIAIGLVIVALLAGLLVVQLTYDDAPTEVQPGDTTPLTDEPTSTEPVSSSTTVSDGVDSPTAGEEQSAAQQRWLARAGEPYLLSFDVASEGYFGVYCVSGVAADPSQLVDLVALTAGTDLSCNDGQPFDYLDPVGVETLLEWADQAISDGGAVEYSSDGVPTSIRSDLGEGFSLSVIDFSFDPSGGPGIGEETGETYGSGEELSTAQQAWADLGSVEYFLALDITSEGLAGRYCSSGVTDDPAADDLIAAGGGLLAECADGQRFADDFADPVSVLALFDWAAQVLADGGNVSFAPEGYPNYMYSNAAEGYEFEVTVVAFEFGSIGE